MPNDPLNCLMAWTALEVLSPATFRTAADLAASCHGKHMLLDGPLLPWEDEAPALPAKQRYYYHVILGSISYEAAIHALLEKYGDKSPERPTLLGEVALASLLLDAQGKLQPSQGVAVGSFGWGLPVALEGNLGQLFGWKDVETEFIKQTTEALVRTDNDGVPLPVDKSALARGRKYLLEQLKIPAEFTVSGSFAIRCVAYSSAPPEPILLNSFFLGDLALARQLFREGRAPMNLRRYLGVVKPEFRQNLLGDADVLDNLLRPAYFSPGRWPGPGRHSLVLLQQAAVNAALQVTPEQSILAVNGPPGTGKTTLLRDVVAALVTKRAEALCLFDNPNDAFKKSKEKLSFGGGSVLSLYSLDASVKGYEMLVASSNNKAVENVSAELPGLEAVADDAVEQLRYFTSLSDALLGKKSWGLIAAVLGNASNKYKFSQTFWWDPDFGMSTYLAEAAGTQQWIDERDPATNKITGQRKPKIIESEGPPSSPEDAIDRWIEVKRKFKQVLADARSQLDGLEAIRALLLKQTKQIKTVDNAQLISSAKEGEYSEARRLLVIEQNILAVLTTATLDAGQQRVDHYALRPGFWSRLFRTILSKAWTEQHKVLTESLEQAKQSQSDQERLVAHRSRDLSLIELALRRAQDELDEAQASLQKLNESIDTLRFSFPGVWLDRSFFQQAYHSRHLSIPWCDAAIHRLRDGVFASALQVHKAFIDAAAKPIRHNLGALMYVFSKGSLPDDEKMALLPDLWSSLFLVVPALSTTFASTERLLGKLPPASFGWLLVDEAGQSLPQAAVGALLRTQRAIIVGDPLQIEPVVVLPESLTHAICQRFDIDPLQFNAPKASVQTLADAATFYYAEFESLQGSRSVGVPLLVHRRCADPVFSISNTIAYARLMIKATPTRTSRIRDCLGPSSWTDVQGTADEKWCAEEGQMVLKMLNKLKAKGIPPNLYIVTPFAIVAGNLRSLVRQSGVQAGWISDPKWPDEHIGTVHTVQGREAEAVIFVLGAPGDTQNGARMWAGRTPNILNVAVTRAKEVLYVVGNKRLWQSAGVFQQLVERIE